MPAIPISARARSITDSITLAIDARAKAMRKSGIDVVSLGAGEPDFATPSNIAEAGVRAIHDGHTRYTAAAGMPELRAAGASWLDRRFGVPFEAANVMVTAGAKPALMLALDVMVNSGDRVLLPAPFWASYTEIVRLAGGEPVVLDAVPERQFVHTGQEIARAARECGAKGFVINFPNNPSGAVPSREQVEDIVDAAIDNDLWILSDEIYARLIYDGSEHVSPASVGRGLDRVVVVNGGTKSHSMTGWRIGFLGGPPDVIAAAARIQSQAIGNPCSISQRAALALCGETDDQEFSERLSAFDSRRHFLAEAIGAIPGLQADLPKGAFYLLADVRDLCTRNDIDDVQFAERLLVEGRVATVPGTPFAIPGFIRLSYAASMDHLREATTRIGSFVESLK